MKGPNISKDNKLAQVNLMKVKYLSAKQLPMSEAPVKMSTVQHLFGYEEEGHK